ncbi:MAG TPA: OmpA family protein [Candidatus Binatia bacterium]
MNKTRLAAVVTIIFFLAGCATLDRKTNNALIAGGICGAAGAGAGAGAAHIGRDTKLNEGAGAGIGFVTGALLCGALAYIFTEEPRPAPPPPPPPPPPAPKPVPPPPPPPPPPPKPVPPPPPPPPPAPKAERTIILDNVLFDFDKTAIKPDGAKILDRLIAFLKENSDKRVSLEGHTDSIGTEQYNQGLSERRANSVKDYLTKRGVDAGKISTRGFGETRPIADNKTAEGRAKNRRVEIKVQ